MVRASQPEGSAAETATFESAAAQSLPSSLRRRVGWLLQVLSPSVKLPVLLSGKLYLSKVKLPFKVQLVATVEPHHNHFAPMCVLPWYSLSPAGPSALVASLLLTTPEALNNKTLAWESEYSGLPGPNEGRAFILIPRSGSCQNKWKWEREYILHQT